MTCRLYVKNSIAPAELGFDGEPPKTVMKDSGTREWTLWRGQLQLQLVQLLVRHLLVLDMGTDHL
jgi:hypothetical protein